MLLHSGSGFHAHEYSAPTAPTTTTAPILKRSSLVRSAFSHAPPKPSLVRYDSDIKPISSILNPETRRHTVGVSFVEAPKVMEDDEITDTMSDDGKSLISRDGSEATSAGGRRSSRRKKARKDKTCYALAHPAPTLLQKQQLVHLRPQLLLQLQRVSAETRPLPVLDVLPSAVFVPRLSKKFPAMFKGRGGLGPNDILCVKSEDYCTSDRDSSGSDADEDGWASREVEAVICQAKKGDAKAAGQAEILFSSGSKWTAIPLSGGIYEFTSSSERGLKTTARWVRRSTAQRSNSDMKDKLPSTPVSKTDTKFNFSIIDPNSRRHPVIASITTNSLEIPDTYTLLSPSIAKSRHSTGGSNSPSKEDSEPIASSQDEPPQPQEKTTVPVSDFLQKLIQITGVWVALRQGWSPIFKYDDFSPPSSQIRGTPSAIPSHVVAPTSNGVSSNCMNRSRSVSLDYRSRQSSSTDVGHHHTNSRAGVETPESLHSSSAGGVNGISRKIKRLSGQRNSTFLANAAATNEDGAKGNEGRRRNYRQEPMRSTSAGAAFMAKIAARRINNGGGGSGGLVPSTVPSTVPSDSDGESCGALDGGASRTSLSQSQAGHLGTSSDPVAGKSKRMSNPSPLAVVEAARRDSSRCAADSGGANDSENSIPAKSQQRRPVSMPFGATAVGRAPVSAGARWKKGWKGKVVGFFRRGGS